MIISCIINCILIKYNKHHITIGLAMVTFSFEKDIARFHSAWSEWKYSVYHKDTPRHYNLSVQGFYGSGKTEFLRQFCELNKTLYI